MPTVIRGCTDATFCSLDRPHEANSKAHLICLGARRNAISDTKLLPNLNRGAVEARVEGFQLCQSQT